MEWEQQKQKPEPLARSEARCGPITLHVSDDGARRWQHMHMSFGEFSDAPFSECVETWPMEVIHTARRALDELESQLQGET